MLHEPYICVAGDCLGNLESFEREYLTPFPKIVDRDGTWIPYATFEREKLRALGEITKYSKPPFYLDEDGYNIWTVNGDNHSNDLIGYDLEDYERDSESTRLLKRAEFLKAVCENEGVEWLCKDGEFWITGNKFEKEGEWLAVDPCCGCLTSDRPCVFKQQQNGDRELGSSAAGASDESRSRGQSSRCPEDQPSHEDGQSDDDLDAELQEARMALLEAKVGWLTRVVDRLDQQEKPDQKASDTFTKAEVEDMLAKVQTLSELYACRLRNLDQKRWDYVANALECIGKQSKCIFSPNPREALLPPDDGEDKDELA